MHIKKEILALKRNLPSEKRIMRFSHQSLERAKFRVKFPSLNVIQTGSKNGRPPNVTKGPQSGMRSKKSLRGISSIQTSQRVVQEKKDTAAMSTKQTSPEVTSLQR